jgi:hypothetical protein
MYDTSGSHSVCYAPPADAELTQRRLTWLTAELARDESRRKLSRTEEERALSLLGPRTTEAAYAWFGTFLGLLPPFAIFARILGRALAESTSRHLPTADGALYWGLLFLSMNAVCCLVGRKFGAHLGRKMGDPRRWSWPALVFCSMLMGVAWAVVTGGAGGALGLGIGAVVGVLCAMPVALAAFPVFATLHRAHSHGGMIEARQLWPLALGIPFYAAVLILSPWIN